MTYGAFIIRSDCQRGSEEDVEERIALCLLQQVLAGVAVAR